MKVQRRMKLLNKGSLQNMKIGTCKHGLVLAFTLNETAKSPVPVSSPPFRPLRASVPFLFSGVVHIVFEDGVSHYDLRLTD